MFDADIMFLRQRCLGYPLPLPLVMAGGAAGQQEVDSTPLPLPLIETCPVVPVLWGYLHLLFQIEPPDMPMVRISYYCH